MPQGNDDIALKSEIINIHIYRNIYEVAVDYVFENHGSARDVVMGFPNEEGAETEGFKDFKAFDQGKQLKVEKKLSEKTDYYTKYFECFTVSFKKGQTKYIKNTYSNFYERDYDGNMRRLKYILSTGSLWKGKIEAVTVNLLLENVTSDEINQTSPYFKMPDGKGFKGIDISPASYEKTPHGYKMEFKNIEPDFDIVITMPPLLYNSVKASSVLKDTSFDYSPENVFDGDPATAWVEGVKGAGIGQSLSIDITPYTAGGKINGYYVVDKIGIIGGYASSADIFHKNNRVKRLQVDYESQYIENGEPKDMRESKVFTLRDTMDMQYLKFPHPVKISSFTVTILDVYKGSRYDDTCIAELRLFTSDIGFVDF
ncbi:MAG: discoidin domain-containing protein [Spirochaetia bacterium]